MTDYNEQAVLRELQDRLEQLGIGGKLELLRHGSTSVYRVHGRSLIVRVTREPLSNRLAVVAGLTRLRDLADHGATILGPSQLEPLTMKDAWATLWPEGQRSLDKPSYALGRALSQLHRVDPPEGLPVGSVAAIDRADERIKDALRSGVPSKVIDTLQAKGLDVRSKLAQLETGTAGLAHGDAHTGNLVEYKGQPVLIDLDDLCVGPREIDFAPSFVSSRRFSHLHAAYEELLQGYGLRDSNVDHHSLEIYSQLRELTMISWLATLWRVEPRSRRELRNRIEGWDDPSAGWYPL